MYVPTENRRAMFLLNIKIILTKVKKWIKNQTRRDRLAFCRLISWKVWQIWNWNFDTSSIQVFNLCYENLDSISLIAWKLCAFLQRSNFDNFQQFFHHNFQLKLKFLILMVSLEISSLDHNIPYFNFKKYFVFIKINFQVKK